MRYFRPAPQNVEQSTSNHLKLASQTSSENVNEKLDQHKAAVTNQGQINQLYQSHKAGIDEQFHHSSEYKSHVTGLLKNSAFGRQPSSTGKDIEMAPQEAFSHAKEFGLSDDKHLFFGFICVLMNGLDSGLEQRLNGLLNQNWPPDTLVQCGLILSPDLNQTLRQLRKIQNNITPEFKSMLEQNICQLKDGVKRPVTNGQRLRRGCLWMTVKTPISQFSPTHDDIIQHVRLQQSFSAGLETTGLAAIALDQNDWLQLNRILVNHPEKTQWLDAKPSAEDDRSLNQQVFDPDTSLQVEQDHLVLGTGEKKRYIKVLIAKQLPQFAPLGIAFNFMGDSQSGHRSIKCYAQIHTLLNFPDIRQLQATLNNRQRIATQQASGPITRFEPRLMERKSDFDILFNALNKGDAPLKLTFALVLYCDSLKEANMLSSNVCSYYRELGFMLYEDVYFMLPMFLNTLPGNAQKASQTIAMHEKTLATRHAVPPLPLFDD